MAREHEEIKKKRIQGKTIVQLLCRSYAYKIKI